MKKLITILLIVSAINANAQLSDAFKSTMIITSSIVFDAMADGYRDNGNLIVSHSLEAASLLPLIISPFILDLQDYKWAAYLIQYTTLRIAIFDPIYNLTRGLPISYIGDSSLWDKALKKQDPSWILAARGLSFAISISIPIKYY